jgi:hypothetical protein
MSEPVDPPNDVWVHPALDVRSSAVAGRGLFATKPLPAGEVVVRVGGRLVTTDELHRTIADAGPDTYIDTVAVGDDTHLILPPGTAAHYGNHSCDPSMWPIGAYELATRRAIGVDEELTIDYALISDDPSFRMDCRCASSSCRHLITGEDWRRADLQDRYAGHWPPGLQRRIDVCDR